MKTLEEKSRKPQKRQWDYLKAHGCWQLPSTQPGPVTHSVVTCARTLPTSVMCSFNLTDWAQRFCKQVLSGLPDRGHRCCSKFLFLRSSLEPASALSLQEPPLRLPGANVLQRRRCSQSGGGHAGCPADRVLPVMAELLQRGGFFSFLEEPLGTMGWAG